MFKHISIAGLTLVSVFLASVTSSHAEIAGNVNSLTIQNIERVPDDAPIDPPVDQPSTPRSTIGVNKRSLRYTELGFSAQKKGKKEQALGYYVKAVETDPDNAYAFMLAGTLLGGTKEGIVCMKAAATIFRQKGDREGYDLAVNWLEANGIDF
jgi:tetratricopeptide (TPR) repeat protein